MKTPRFKTRIIDPNSDEARTLLWAHQELNAAAERFAELEAANALLLDALAELAEECYGRMPRDYTKKARELIAKYTRKQNDTRQSKGPAT